MRPRALSARPARPRVPLCALRVACRLGVTLSATARWTGERTHKARRREAAHAAARLLNWLEPGDCALISGPSGAGKTTLLRAIARRVRARGVRGITPRALPGSCLVARVGVSTAGARAAREDDLDAWLGTLARLGLAEAGALLARVGTLSAGQRARVQLADAAWRAARAPRPACLLIDEFGGTLDRLTVRALCAGLRRLSRAHGLRLIIAASHHDVHAMLRPDVHARVSLLGRITLERARAGHGGGGAPCA